MGNGPSTRRVVRIVAGTAGALYLLYLIRSVLELILLAVFVALWLGTFVEFFTRRRVPRVAAIIAAYLALFASILFLGFVAVPPIVRQINAGVRQPPRTSPSSRERDVPQVRQQVQDHPEVAKPSAHASHPAREHRQAALRGYRRGIHRSHEAHLRPGTGVLSPARRTAAREPPLPDPRPRSGGAAARARHRHLPIGVRLRRREHRDQRGRRARGLHHADGARRRVRGAAGRNRRRVRPAPPSSAPRSPRSSSGS